MQPICIKYLSLNDGETFSKITEDNCPVFPRLIHFNHPLAKRLMPNCEHVISRQLSDGVITGLKKGKIAEKHASYFKGDIPREELYPLYPNSKLTYSKYLVIAKRGFDIEECGKYRTLTILFFPTLSSRARSTKINKLIARFKNGAYDNLFKKKDSQFP